MIPNMVKGVGYAGGDPDSLGSLGEPNLKPIRNPERILKHGTELERELRAAVERSQRDPEGVRKGISPEFMQMAGSYAPGLFSMTGGGRDNGMQSLVADIQRFAAELGKSFTLTAPLSTGLVPYDLLAPARLVWNVYSPLRNRFPRVAGQGLNRLAKVGLAIPGTQVGGTNTSGGAPIDVSISELNGGTIDSASLNLPPAVSSDFCDLSVPYRFFGLSQNVSWLAQFAGQGFQDVDGLANLILMQAATLAEEYQIMSGTSNALATPGAPTVLANRSTANPGETLLSFSNSLFVRVSALTHFGETAAGPALTLATATYSGHCVDLQIAPVRGAIGYNVYVSNGSAEPANGSRFLYRGKQGANVQKGGPLGGAIVTLQGTMPTSGANPLTADSGTSAATRMEGMFSVLSGHASTDAGIYPTTPVNFVGGYYNNAIGQTLNTSVLMNAVTTMYDGSVSAGDQNLGVGGWRADPEDLIGNAQDLKNLAMDMLSKNAQTGAYQFFISQDEVGDLRAGAAVSQFQNPITHSVVRLMVHPWWPQGSAMLMSYQPPMNFSEVSNIWENVMVQDYLSVNWPTIDMRFRYSMFWFGALLCYAPWYNAYLGGLQASVATSTTGTFA